MVVKAYPDQTPLNYEMPAKMSLVVFSRCSEIITDPMNKSTSYFLHRYSLRYSFNRNDCNLGRGEEEALSACCRLKLVKMNTNITKRAMTKNFERKFEKRLTGASSPSDFPGTSEPPFLLIWNGSIVKREHVKGKMFNVWAVWYNLLNDQLISERIIRNNQNAPGNGWWCDRL